MSSTTVLLFVSLVVMLMSAGCKAPSAAVVSGLSWHEEARESSTTSARLEEYTLPGPPQPQGPPRHSQGQGRGHGRGRGRHEERPEEPQTRTRVVQERVKGEKYNHFNPGLGFEWETMAGPGYLRGQLGIMDNSENDLMPYAMGSWNYPVTSWAQVGPFVGLGVYGGDVTPMGGAGLLLFDRLQFGVMPDFGQGGGTTGFFQLRIPLGGK